MSRDAPEKGLLTRLRGDRRGVSAVEFALIAPIMILFYFGLAEFCQAFMAQKRMGRTAAAVADLVTQKDQVTRADLADIFEVGGLMMRPFSAAPLSQRATAVTRQTNGRVEVDWSLGQGMAPRGEDSEVTLPEGLIAVGESLVMTEITYDYESPFADLLPKMTRFSHTYYLRPRKVDQVACTDC